jgi:hypothetical protein
VLCCWVKVAEGGGVPVLRARTTRVETAASTRRAGRTIFFRHQAITARTTGAGILDAVASLDAH